MVYFNRPDIVLIDVRTKQHL